MTKQCRVLAGVGTVVALIASLAAGCMSGRMAGEVPVGSMARVPAGIDVTTVEIGSEAGYASVSDVVQVANQVPVSVAGEQVALRPVRVPCGPPCGCTCVPNARCFGYFPTTWRTWPCDSAPSLPAPHGPGYEPTVAPPNAPPAPMPPEMTAPEKKPAAKSATPAPAELKPILPPEEPGPSAVPELEVPKQP